MKRFSDSDSPAPLLYQLEADHEKIIAKENQVYSSEFQAMLDGLDEEDSIEESECSRGKKRRLSIDQVQALEKIFEVDNKLDPERKLRVAQELGLQPQQVAIWFQNRRARWKTKQLERDYKLLKANYEALQMNYSKVEQEKQGLISQLRGLKEKLKEETAGNDVTNSPLMTSSQGSLSKRFPGFSSGVCSEFEMSYNRVHDLYQNVNLSSETTLKLEFRDGFSDTDSSGLLDEKRNFMGHSRVPYSSPNFVSSALSLPSSVYNPELLDSGQNSIKLYHHQQSPKAEDQSFFSNNMDGSCNIFSVDQAPNVYWYFPDQRTL